MAYLKTYLESGKSNIKAVESELRRVCFEHNINTVKLYSEKIDWFEWRLYIHLESENPNHLLVIKKYLERLTD